MRCFRRSNAKPHSRTIFGEYCSTSSVHGVRYFSDPERTICEKFWWIVMFVVSVSGCVVLIWSTWQKWILAPIVMNFENQPIPVTEIPFPSFTICPPGKVSKSMYDFGKEAKELKSSGSYANASDNFLAMVQMCEILFKFSKHYSIKLRNKKYPLSYSAVVENISVPMENFIGKCDFNDYFSCEYLFQYVMTDMGLCVNFNMLQKYRMLRRGSFPKNDPFIFPRGRGLRTGRDDNGGVIDLDALLGVDKASQEENSTSTTTASPRNIRKRSVSRKRNPIDIWFPEEGYIKKQTLDNIPTRGLGAGKYRAFNLALIGHEDDMSKECDDLQIRGHKILFHSPVDYPHMINSVVIPFDHITQIAVKPLVVKTSPKVRNYPPERRQCFFEDERYLKYFLVYTQNNCELECLSNYTLARCGCVKYSMMRSEEMKVCETINYPCLHNAVMEFVKTEDPTRRFTFGKRPKLNAFSFRGQCNCLPACTSYQYDFEIFKQSFGSGKIDGITADYLGTLSVFFKEPQFIAMIRSELYGFTDFIANCGGLLGLFTGTSLLSLVEIAYFCFVRPLSRRINRSRVSSVHSLPPVISTVSGNGKACEEIQPVEK
ncbi:sodium channel protein Nach [Aedes aegypti]|uniref:Uncharacterized protein n=1 Tax=Aedes aegypti TaxID=7159 RepID=A0A6I8TVR1_AEDAE|nr:sodium channel protein Nach [Aedes aegypti]